MASLVIREVSIITIYYQRNVTPIRNAIRRKTNQLDLPTDRILNAVDQAQSAVERELDGELLEADIDKATEFRDRVREALVHAATRLVATRLANYTIMAAIDGRNLTVRCLTDTVKANKVELEETRKQGMVDCRQTVEEEDCRVDRVRVG